MERGSNRRILFVSYTAEWNGPTNSLHLLITHLSPGYDACVVLPRRGPFTEKLEATGIDYISLPALTKWEVPSLVRLIRDEDVGFVYANSSDGTSRVSLLAAKLTGRPCACQVRAVRRQTSWRKLGHLRFADSVVAVSRAAARTVERFVGDGRLHVVYNGVDPEAFPGPTEAARARLRDHLGVSNDSKILLNVGHWRPRKGQAQAVEVIRQVVQESSDVHLCLVGKPRDEIFVRDLRKRVRAYGLVDHVHFLGFRTDVPELMQGADMVLHTSESEAHPRVLLEAMASRLPVVAFDADGVREALVDGETGRLVPRGNVDAAASVVGMILDSPEMRRRMGAAGRSTVRDRFSARRAATEVERIIAPHIDRDAR